MEQRGRGSRAYPKKHPWRTTSPASDSEIFSKSTVAQTKMGHMSKTGRFVVRRLGLDTVNLYIKYEVSMFTHYEDMKGD